MNILINGITLENANLTPLLINCAHWHSKGHSVTFIGTPTLKRNIKTLTILKHFNFISINCSANLNTNFKLIFYGLKRNLSALTKLNQIKGRFNIIHSRSSVLDLIIFPFIVKLLDPRLKWTTVFDNTVPPTPFLPYFFYRLSLIQLKRADHVFTISTNLKKYLTNKGLNPKKITVTGNGIEADQIKKAKRNTHHSFNAIFVGRLHPAKGIFDLIKITQIITKKYSHFKLIILDEGDQSTKTKFKQTITNQNLNKNISLLGFKSGIEKYNLIKSSHVFIFPSYQESFGIALLEAVCCGLPAFAYNLPVYQKIYRHKEINTFPKGNYQSLAKAVVKTLKLKQFSNPQGKLLLNQYSWQKIAQIELQAFLNLI